MIRVLIADDHQLFRQGMVKLLEESKEICVVGEAADGQALIHQYYICKPDIILSDISMPVKSGIEAVKKICESEKGVKALFLSMYSGDEYVYSVLEAGGKGLLNKNAMAGEVINAIRTVVDGEPYFIGYTEESLLKLRRKYMQASAKSNRASIETLTDKEREVLMLIGDGLSSVQISEKMFISKRTVDSHRSKILDKLNIKSLPELMKAAVEYAYSKK